MTSDELAAIRQRDYWASDCNVCESDAKMPHHGPIEEGCPAPQDHHAYVKGVPRDDADRDIRALLEYVDELRGVIAGPIIEQVVR